MKSLSVRLLAYACLSLACITHAAAPQTITYCDISSPPQVDPNNAPTFFAMEVESGYLHWTYTNFTANPAEHYEIIFEEDTVVGLRETVVQSTEDSEIDYGYHVTVEALLNWEGCVQERIAEYTGTLPNPDTYLDYLKKVKYRGHSWDSYMQCYTAVGPDGAVGSVKMNILYWPVWYHPNSTNVTATSGTFNLTWSYWEEYGTMSLPLSSQNYMLIGWEAP